MHLRCLFWHILITILIVGCSLKPEQPKLTPFTQTSTPILVASAQFTKALSTETTLPVLKDTPSPTLDFTETQPSTSTISPVDANPIRQKCLTVLPELPEQNTYDGTIILAGEWILESGKYDFEDPWKFKSYYSTVPFFDLNTRQTHLFPQYKIPNIAASPDGTKYALLDANDYRIKIFSADGRLLNTIPRPKDPWMFSQWLDNEHLFLVIEKPYGQGTTYISYPPDIVVVDILTNEQKLIRSDYPDIDQVNARNQWYGGGITRYDPALTRVIYFGGPGYILWDLINQKEVVRIDGSNPYDKVPVWSSDGSKLFAVGPDELVQVTRDGKITQLTKTDGGIWGFVLSPDGKQIAYWSAKADEITLAILNLGTGEITDTCISAGKILGASYLSVLEPPIWSPDGKYLAVVAYHQQEWGKYDTLLVDPERGIAAKIGESLTPVGWLNTTKK